LTVPARILTVCTHNRTRSVMMAAFLQAQLDERLGAGTVAVGSSGFASEGWPPIDDAVTAMSRRGIDVSAHRSRLTTPDLVETADLIITAERDHVVRVASLSTAAFTRTMTLPEALARSADRSGRAAGGGIVPWAVSLTSGRTAAAYLREPVREVADPTGTSARVFEQAVAEIERQCGELSLLVVAALGG
jgi:protein-tyrosine-phosphatase